MDVALYARVSQLTRKNIPMAILQAGTRRILTQGLNKSTNQALGSLGTIQVANRRPLHYLTKERIP